MKAGRTNGGVGAVAALLTGQTITRPSNRSSWRRIKVKLESGIFVIICIYFKYGAKSYGGTLRLVARRHSFGCHGSTKVEDSECDTALTLPSESQNYWVILIKYVDVQQWLFSSVRPRQVKYKHKQEEHGSQNKILWAEEPQKSSVSLPNLIRVGSDQGTSAFEWYPGKILITVSFLLKKWIITNFSIPYLT